MKIRWLKTSLTNLENAFNYYSSINPDLANNFANEITSSINNLIANPYIGREGRVFGTRELVIKKYPYIIPYRVKNKEIQILRVLHVKQRY